MVGKTFKKPPHPPSIAPMPFGRSKGVIHEDSSWITSPTTENLQRAKKSVAMKDMTKAFVKSMRCSLEEAECQSNYEDRIESIDFGKLLAALDVMKDCMKIYGMTRTTADLEYHSSNAKMLYMAAPPQARDSVSYLLKSSESKQDKVSRKSDKAAANSSTFNTSFIRAFSINSSHDDLVTEPPPLGTRAQSLNPELLKDAALKATNQVMSTPLSPKKTFQPTPPCLLDALDRKKARNSMFWLCYFVRYMYTVHRLVLQIGHDAVDASPMAFMRYLQPHFLDYYTETKDAKAYLKLLADYQNEHFLGDATSGGTKGIDPQARLDLRSFLGVIEVVMYLWTPAFQEMALQ